MIKFQVRDPEGLWGSKSKDILVNIAPIAYAGENVSTTPNVPVQFNGQGSDEDGEIVFYEWDFDEMEFMIGAMKIMVAK